MHCSVLWSSVQFFSVVLTIWAVNPCNSGVNLAAHNVFLVSEILLWSFASHNDLSKNNYYAVQIPRKLMWTVTVSTSRTNFSHCEMSVTWCPLLWCRNNFFLPHHLHCFSWMIRVSNWAYRHESDNLTTNSIMEREFCIFCWLMLTEQVLVTPQALPYTCSRKGVEKHVHGVNYVQGTDQSNMVMPTLLMLKHVQSWLW